MSTTLNSDNTVTIEIAGIDVTLPVRFSHGHRLSENEAKVLDAAYQRQFTNNQNAMAKARKDARDAGKTDPKYNDMTASQLAELYATYEPNVGGARLSSMDKIRNDAGWKSWQIMAAQHKAALDAGKASPWFNHTRPIVIPGRKTSMSLPDGTIVTQTVEEYRENTVNTVLNAKSAKVQALVQEQIDALVAEREAAKANTTSTGAVVVASADDFA